MRISKPWTLGNAFSNLDSLTSLLLWWIILNNFISIFFFRCFIVLHLCFYITGYSTNKIHVKHLQMGIIAIPIWGSFLCVIVYQKFFRNSFQRTFLLIAYKFINLYVIIGLLTWKNDQYIRTQCKLEIEAKQ